jgi:DNA-binding transcriptional LysR family regulator
VSPILRQVRALVVLARTANFTPAAQHLHVAQSALSGLIKEFVESHDWNVPAASGD